MLNERNEMKIKSYTQSCQPVGAQISTQHLKN